MNRKERGELSELAFIYKATGLGFHVSKPYGDSSPYDFVVEHLGRLSKVQVKSTSAFATNGGYVAHLQRRVQCGVVFYQPGDLDVYTIHVVPMDAWYIVPHEVVGRTTAIILNPNRPGHDRRFGCYREAWHLLEGFARSADPLVTFNIDACDESAGVA